MFSTWKRGFEDLPLKTMPGQMLQSSLLYCLSTALLSGLQNTVRVGHEEKTITPGNRYLYRVDVSKTKKANNTRGKNSPEKVSTGSCYYCEFFSLGVGGLWGRRRSRILPGVWLFVCCFATLCVIIPHPCTLTPLSTNTTLRTADQEQAHTTTFINEL